MMKWIQRPLGPLQTNAYIIYNESRECLIIDPGEEGAALNNWLKSKKLSPLAILLTHAHFDHIGAVDEVRTMWDIPVYIHEKEKKWLVDPSKNGSRLFPIGKEIKINPADHLFTKEQVLTISTFSCKVLETPGHSPGSVSFYFEDSAVIFSGDVLFEGSIGRTDLPGGNHELLLNSIHKKLLVLPEDVIVCSGHGNVTNIQVEMDSNPFLNGF